MSSLVLVGSVVLGTVALLGGIFSAVGLGVRSLRQRALGEAMLLVNGEVLVHDDSALSLGVESRGRTQLRGNGTLVCSRDEVLFTQWMPHRTLQIRRSDIVVVETCRSHLGNTQGAELLKVVFRTEAGEDSIALRVADLQTWLRTLTEHVALLETSDHSESRQAPRRLDAKH